jgi:hypothetical protein
VDAPGTPWQPFASHRYRRDGDTLYFEIHGTFSLDDTRLLFELGETVERECGYVLNLFDAHDAQGLAADARRHIGTQLRQRKSASAIVGASVAMRALITLLQNSATLFGRPTPSTRFFASVEEAAKWLTSQRLHLSGRTAPAGQ